MLALFALLAVYLLGSIPFGLIVARRRGIDLQKVGSGNIGATNAARALGKGWGGFVLLLDAAKATVPVFICGWILRDHPRREWMQAAVGVAALCGHVFSVFLRFHGGKGVATTVGCLLALEPEAALLGLLAFAVAYRLTRISSVGSLSAVLLFPLWLHLCHASAPTWAFTCFALFLILLRHEGNIRRLLRRQERKV